MTSIDVTTQTLRVRSSNAPKGARKKETKTGGIEVARYFTRPGVDVYDTCEWEMRNAAITNERGEVVFEQKDVEMPRFWSQMATNVVVSK
jgi:ribonucleoside-diphosphate reductase alpha chain